ncbi:MAG: NAD(P)H-hydrate dehydratase [Alphaproteobacteria bacterium]|jgi:hydroxyethylthiazole kinase-like uncharacterized protein yjeF|nr:NAD(P)H-hydrate dehydratase [Alphaproteobacteria bacterium]
MTRPVLTPEEIRAAEAAAIKAGTPSYALMQRAGAAAAHALMEAWPEGEVHVLCGPGGNGGDGFVAARHLRQAGRSVRVFLLGESETLDGDAARAASDWDGPVEPLSAALEHTPDLVIDALFGAGLSRPLEGAAAQLAARRLPTLSVDVPSGLDGLTGQPRGAVFQADRTLSFAALRPAHLLRPGSGFCGAVEVADIGLAVDSDCHENTPGIWQDALPAPQSDTHKHSRGRLICVTGGPSNTGAARLAAMAGLRAGAGLVTLLSPPSALNINASHVTAIMVRAFSESRALAEAARGADCAVIGPAAGVREETRADTLALLSTQCSSVLDADALTVFAAEPGTLFDALRPEDILTPHPGEFARLFADLIEVSDNRIEAVRRACARAGAVILLKGPDTVIGEPGGRAVINTHASPWLATAGSGDVLAGIIAGLRAQGMPAFEAAAAGAWLHGEAGRRLGHGLISEDLPDVLPAILRECLEKGAGEA